MSAATITACRSCGDTLGAVFCDLGIQPVANAYIPPGRANAPEPAFPLRAVVCRGCRLVQLDTVVDAEGIFADYLDRRARGEFADAPAAVAVGGDDGPEFADPCCASD